MTRPFFTRERISDFEIYGTDLSAMNTCPSEHLRSQVTPCEHLVEIKGVPGCWAVTRGYRGRGPAGGLKNVSVCGQKNSIYPYIVGRSAVGIHHSIIRGVCTFQ